MSIQQNNYVDVPEHSNLTERAANFIESVQFSDLPASVIEIGTRCLVDGLGLYVAGSDHETAKIQAELAAETEGREEAILLGHSIKVPAPLAARVLGTAGHAHDWDDSQVSLDPDHVYGLLTHPTIPPLTAALTMAQKLDNVNGQDFMLAFLTGFEVEAKISEWMFSQHYKRGFHSSGTVGTFGAFAAAAKLLGLTGEQLRSGLGIAASFAAGIRCNFGTMTKPLHVGRAAENGVTAVLMAQKGYSADQEALDGPWGFFAVQGGGVTESKINSEDFGKPFSIVEPGVSIKPYPCGVLTHPTIDLMVKLVKENDVTPENIERVIVRAGSNILNPIRYPIASNHLQAKFSLPAVLAMVALNRRAGKIEFEDEFVQSDAMQSMQHQIETQFDADIEAKGFDKMRSSIDIQLKNGDVISGDADERYRGGPENPMTDQEVEEKALGCCEGVLTDSQAQQLIQSAWKVLQLDNITRLAEQLQPQQ
ncbi:MmgE/PrpD family protein [Photobacterium sp. BZF1]|uniref:MmgE/PrpD family protein n=1 Tax=Photobacterium sp. BZF1 TaxID=1904457 RepID=UPI0016536AC1|nr:MmgE/PrpD family protein [Photobacterium sp. BZF1]MBC7004142.1 MmgE/PrpD family protein [Photobacterium sp. BZF1]